MMTTVSELIRALSGFPGAAQVVVRYDADHVEDGDLEVFSDGDRAVIRTDAALFQETRRA